jgi:large subunit ribosomal protein L30
MTVKKKKDKITIELVRSLNKTENHVRDTVRGLGLKRIRDRSELENTPAVRGMIKKVISYINLCEFKEN